MKLVMFDFADTIAELYPSKETLVKEYIFEKTGIDVPTSRLEEVYYYINNTHFYSSVDIRNLDDKREYYTKYNQVYFELLGLSHMVESDGLYDFFKSKDQHWILKEGVKELLESLKRNGCILSLVSNFDKKLKTILIDMGIYDLFDSIYTSQECNLEKPNLDFFRLPLVEHTVDIKNTYFIGDNYHLDFLPAYRLGIYPILLDERDVYPLIDQQHKVSSLRECQRIIGNVK